jgi:hypothetical protein
MKVKADCSAVWSEGFLLFNVPQLISNLHQRLTQAICSPLTLVIHCFFAVEPNAPDFVIGTA